jgi:hypothetical protein
MISTLLPLGPNTSNPCPIAQKVAEAIIHHIQGGRLSMGHDTDVRSSCHWASASGESP